MNQQSRNRKSTNAGKRCVDESVGLTLLHDCWHSFCRVLRCFAYVWPYFPALGTGGMAATQFLANLAMVTKAIVNFRQGRFKIQRIDAF